MTAKTYPQVSIRTMCQAYGLSIPDLAERIVEHGVDVDGSTIRHIEISRRRPQHRRKMPFWARTSQHLRQEKDARDGRG